VVTTANKIEVLLIIIIIIIKKDLKRHRNHWWNAKNVQSRTVCFWKAAKVAPIPKSTAKSS